MITFKNNGPAGIECNLIDLKTGSISTVNCEDYESF